MVSPAPAIGRTAWLYRCLAPQTWSVQDFVRTDLRTLRLAIASGDRTNSALHLSHVAEGHHPPDAGKGNERAWKEHLMTTILAAWGKENEQAWKEWRMNWSVPVLAKGAHEIYRICQIGGAPTRAHDGTDPVHPSATWRNEVTITHWNQT
jgi:hypothetical protein